MNVSEHSDLPLFGFDSTRVKIKKKADSVPHDTEMETYGTNEFEKLDENQEIV